MFRRSSSLQEVKEARNEKSDSGYTNPDNDPRGPWITSSYVNPAEKSKRPNLVYPIPNPNGNEVVEHPTHAWKYSKTQCDHHSKEKRLWWGQDGNAKFPRLKIYLKEQTKGLVPVDLWKYQDAGTTDEGGIEIKKLFGKAIFDTPKPTKLIKKMLNLATLPYEQHTVLDFFSGSASTAAAIVSQNAKDGGNRNFICVQIPEVPDEGSLASVEGYTTIAEISKERIRRAGIETLKNTPDKMTDFDVGFRVLKIDSSNMNEVHSNPGSFDQSDLLSRVENIKSDRTAEDLLFQVMLNQGVDLTLPIINKKLVGKSVYFVGGDALAACFDKDITEDVVKAMAERKPLYAIFRDDGFPSDDMKINAAQLFKQMTDEHTRVKVI